MTNLILASASPRRSELLRSIGYVFSVIPSSVDESELPIQKPPQYALSLAVAKANEVARVYSDDVVLAADTIVVVGDENILGKPRDRGEAKEMIRELSDGTHRVITGCAIRGRVFEEWTVSTEVTMRELPKTEVTAYLDSGEWRDKAGGYGIQGHAGAFVTSINGSVTSVIGLPLAEVVVALTRCGLPSPCYPVIGG